MSTQPDAFNSDSIVFKNNKQSKFFNSKGILYKILFAISAIFLIVGISQVLTPAAPILPLKSDFSNLSVDVPTSLELDQVIDIGITLSTSGRRSTTYYYYLVSFGESKAIIETTAKSDLVSGNQINVTSDISSKGQDNLESIKTLADVKALNSDLKFSPNEQSSIKVIKQFTASDEFLAKYWGFVVFLIFFVTGIGNYFKRKKESSKENQAQSAPQNSQTATSSANGNTQISNQDYQTTLQDSSQNVRVTEKPNQPNSKPVVYILLAVFLGVFGVHHFYSQKVLYGFLHLIWLIALIAFFFSPENLSGLAVVAFLGFFVTLIASLIQAIIRGFSRSS